MKEICLEIQGKPIAKQRPRFVSRASKKAFNPQETEEGRWIWEARSQIRPSMQMWLPLTGRITLNLVFIMPITKAFSKSKLQLLKTVMIPHVKRPDLDNLIKFVKDCCNTWLWKDDSQVWQIAALKRYGLEARTKIEIIEIDNL